MSESKRKAVRLGRYLLATFLIALLVWATESSPYGMFLATLLIAFILFLTNAVLRLLGELLPEAFFSPILAVAYSFILLESIIYYVVFGIYLNGGTMFRGHTPLVVKGDVTFQGYLLVTGYAVVLTGALYIINGSKRNG